MNDVYRFTVYVDASPPGADRPLASSLQEANSAKVPHQCAPCDLCLSRHERKRIALAKAPKHMVIAGNFVG